MYKIVSAKAVTGATLREVKSITEKVNSSTRTIGVALSPCILPEIGKPNFKLNDGEMEIGIHGKPGIKRGRVKSADEIVEKLVDSILGDLEISKDKDVSVLINGPGSTPLEELYIVYRKVHKYLQSKGINVYKAYDGVNLRHR